MKLPFSFKKPREEAQGATAEKKQTEKKEATPLTAQIQTLTKGLVSIKDVLAPGAIEVDFNNLRIGNLLYRTLFAAGYPRFVSANWLSPLISFEHSLMISMFIYPAESRAILTELKRKIAEMEATIELDIKQGKVLDPAVQVALNDALVMQEQLAKGAEHFFQFGLYVTIPAESQEELEEVTKEVTSTLGALMIVAKKATLQMDDGFKTVLPLGTDKLKINRNMDTTCLATTFPFTSSDLSANEGTLYGINEHNDSLVIFDRFSLENANEVVLGKSGGGKSYLIKLEALRSLMFGTEVLVIDPEEEYRSLTEAVGGEYIDFSFNSPARINPFDLSGVYEEGENELGLKILSIHSLMKVIMGALPPTEDAILDRALILTYKQKGITPDPQTQKSEPPLMEDLYKTLIGMEEKEAKILADRLEKFIKGSLAGIFSQPSTVDIKNIFTVFCIKNLEEELRPIAMFIILDYIWTKIKKDLKKRLLLVDEAWYLMRYPDSAGFLYGIAKRARKYFLGLTTITQDVEDFIVSDYGKAIITNSSIQILLKQSPAAIDKLADVFYLSQGERHLLLASDIGEGLFFAGPSHVAIRVIAAPFEHQLVTTKPEELLRQRRGGAQQQAPLQTANPKGPAPSLAPGPVPSPSTYAQNPKTPVEL